MMSSWRIGLFLSLAMLGGRTAADAQVVPGVDPANGPTTVGVPASNSAATASPSNTGSATKEAAAAAAARKKPDRSFNRVVATRRESVAPATSAARVQNDTLLPYSARAREANLHSAMGSTRPLEARVASQPRAAQSSNNYYPGMRISQHPNANTAPVRRRQTGMGVGVGVMGGAGAGLSTPKRAQVMSGGAGRGR